jgi:tRNA (guanine-N7-)-methyltransferase
VEAGSIVLDLSEANLPVTASGLFGSCRPLEIELGAGNGRFLLEWAAGHPESGFLGVERARKYLELAAARALRRGIVNVRLAHTTAEDLLFRCLAPGSVSALHVYFPDPWPKKRHHKRRFFRPDNVARVAEVLEPGGLIRVKTDHAEYATIIGALLTAEPCLVAAGGFEAFVDLPATHFEIRYARDSRPVYRFAFRRR